MATEKFVIDFDSAQTNIFMLGGGVVLSEPTVCAIATDDKNQIKAKNLCHCNRNIGCRFKGITAVKREIPNN